MIDSSKCRCFATEHLLVLRGLLRFVFHPDIASSRVANCQSVPREGGKVALQAYLSSFGGINKYTDIQAIHSDLYDFSVKLFKQKDIRTFTNLDVTALALSLEQKVLGITYGERLSYGWYVNEKAFQDPSNPSKWIALKVIPYTQ